MFGGNLKHSAQFSTSDISTVKQVFVNPISWATKRVLPTTYN